MNHVQIKMCGMTRVEDAKRAVSLGVDAIGLNFYPSSPRFLSVERALDIAEAVDSRVELFGIFVDDIFDRVEEIRSLVGLDRIQFHGDEEPEEIASFGPSAVKAIRFKGAIVEPQWERYPTVWGFLIEPQHETLFGGSGRSWRYESLAGVSLPRRWWLAGGLKASNVEEAILSSGARAVDVCSGVESIPGIKDAQRMSEFVREVRRVEEAL